MDAVESSRATRPTVASAAEREIAARYIGGVGWPTVMLTVALAGAIAASSWFAVTGVVPMLVGTVVNSLLVYAFYTVHHDATHKAISGRVAKWSWLDAACGTVAAAALQLDFRGYAGTHLRHHAHTNQPDDPDIVVKGPFWQLPIKWAIGTILGAIATLPMGDKLAARLEAALFPPPPDAPVVEPNERRQAESRRVRRWMQYCNAVLVATIPFGAFVPALLLWWLPAQFGILLLVILFQWLPHVPFDRTDRMGATRVNRFLGSTWLLLQQDHHLVHHLHPSIPWYRYRAAFRELRPILEANGAVIEGRDTEPHVPIRLGVAP